MSTPGPSARKVGSGSAPMMAGATTGGTTVAVTARENQAGDTVCDLICNGKAIQVVFAKSGDVIVDVPD